jgi:hypothetical protein
MKRSGIVVGIVVGVLVAVGGGWVSGQQKQSDEFTSMDYAEILHLYAKYIQAVDGIWMDGKKGEHYANAFTEDGIMQAGPPRDETPLVGRENLLKFGRPGPSRMRHIVPNVQVHPLPGGGAEAWAYIMLIDMSKNPPTIASHRATKDTLEKTPDGWRIKRRMNSSISTNTPFGSR